METHVRYTTVRQCADELTSDGRNVVAENSWKPASEQIDIDDVL